MVEVEVEGYLTENDNNLHTIVEMEDISINYSFDFYETCSKSGHSILICQRLHFSV